ncbi:hypothetical protein M3Y94_00526800 [Aphelenchoides besseyi]|nr:hypothetical protein M3Y94_00526800 [Aphelenchoides besseyi]KAI6225919.1 Mediator complex subunit 23 [Aphelenchoides besseyi]
MSVDDPKTSADGDEDETKSGITFQLALKELRTASWYWGPISPQKAEHLLNNQPPGTFLLRDSRNERYFFSFSYRTDQGCFHTHVGLHCGRWCLGGPNSLIRSDSFSLIEFVNKAINASNDKNHYEILLHHRVPDETTASIQLKNGFSRYRTATLKYFARLAIRNSLRSELNLNKLVSALPLSRSLKRYVLSPKYLIPN